MIVPSACRTVTMEQKVHRGVDSGRATPVRREQTAQSGRPVKVPIGKKQEQRLLTTGTVSCVPSESRLGISIGYRENCIPAVFGFHGILIFLRYA
jgi:hypothetical protein